MLLTKDQILAADDIKVERVHIPDWGGDVMVRGLTGEQRDEWEASLTMRAGRGPKAEMVPNMRNFRARLVVLCVVDETGQLLFGPQDVATLAKKSGAPLDKLYGVAARLSGITDSDVEELTKDFTQTDGGASSST